MRPQGASRALLEQADRELLDGVDRLRVLVAQGSPEPGQDLPSDRLGLCGVPCDSNQARVVKKT